MTGGTYSVLLMRNSEKNLEDQELRVKFGEVMKSPLVIKQDDPLLIEVRISISEYILSLIH